MRVGDAAGQTASQAYTVIILPSQPVVITTAPSLPDATVNTAYSLPFAVGGGTAPYTFSLTAGSLPPGMTFSSAGVVSGTSATLGTFNFTVLVTDAMAQTASLACTLRVIPPQLTITTASLSSGTAGTAYNQTLSTGGGSPPVTWSLANGALPPGVTLSSVGVISGTPSANGSFSFTAAVTDASLQTASRQFTIAVSPTPLAINAATLSGGTVGVFYTASLTATGGATPYTWSIASGQPPAGLALSQAGGTISGTPTATGVSSFTAQAVDSGGQVATRIFSIAVAPAPLAITTTTLPDGIQNAIYGAPLAVSGGTAPFTWSLSAGTLPAGVTLSASGILSGTPGASGTASFTVAVADAGGQQATRALSLHILAVPLVITTVSLPSGNVNQAYSQALAGSGGTPPLSWSLDSGSLPSGLTLSAAGTISGTPSAAGGFSFTARLSDSASQTTTRQFSIAMVPTPLTITSPSLPNGQASTAYNFTAQASGGVLPYAWSIAAGALPAGLTLSGSGAIAGVPTAPGIFPVTLRVSDSNAASVTQAYNLTVVSGTALVVSTATLSDADQNVAYSATLAASGGTPGYTWSMTAGSLSAGLALSAGGVISGSPTQSGVFNFTAQVTDALNATATAQLSLLVVAPLSITTTTLPTGVQGTAYSANITATGGKAPLSWSVTSGTLPAGITLTGSGVLAGTPTATGSATVTVQVADAGSRQATRQFTVTIVAPLVITPPVSPDGTQGVPYSLSFAATGGTAPYTWSLASGALPAGLTLATTGVLSGTPTTLGTFTFTVAVTDAGSRTATLQVVVAVATPVAIVTSTMPDLVVGVPVNFQFTASGGLPPYTWLVSSGTLPAGLTLSLERTALRHADERRQLQLHGAGGGL